jgi:2'-5' RNA ligase
VPRLFLGTFLSKEQQVALHKVRAKNQDLASKWGCQVRWVNHDKLHLTWIFFGEVEEAKVAELKDAVNLAVKDNCLDVPLSLSLDRLEAWSVRGAPRHMVLVPRAPVATFLLLANSVRNKLKEFVETKTAEQAKSDLRPHVTIMRLQKHDHVKPNLPQLAGPHLASESGGHPLSGKTKVSEIDYCQIDGFQKILPVNLDISHVSLIESQFGPDGTQYRILRDYPVASAQ